MQKVDEVVVELRERVALLLDLRCFGVEDSKQLKVKVFFVQIFVLEIK
jgi:hypothetical protein